MIDNGKKMVTMRISLLYFRTDMDETNGGRRRRMVYVECSLYDINYTEQCALIIYLVSERFIK